MVEARTVLGTALVALAAWRTRPALLVLVFIQGGTTMSSARRVAVGGASSVVGVDTKRVRVGIRSGGRSVGVCWAPRVPLAEALPALPDVRVSVVGVPPVATWAAGPSVRGLHRSRAVLRRQVEGVGFHRSVVEASPVGMVAA